MGGEVALDASRRGGPIGVWSCGVFALSPLHRIPSLLLTLQSRLLLSGRDERLASFDEIDSPFVCVYEVGVLLLILIRYRRE